MSSKNYLAFLLLLLAGSVKVFTTVADNLSQSPVIGVVTVELYSLGLIAKHFDNKTGYIAASYVKFLEGAGAQVVPIWIGRDRSYYEEVLSNINGVLLPGGATWFNLTEGYADAGEHVIEVAKELNDKGIYMPIWGICLGMELLVYKLAKGMEARSDCKARGLALPLELKQDYNQSKMFATASEDIITLQSENKVTYHWHRYCYTEKDFEILQLSESWRTTALNHDVDGIEFISILEHTKYPFYGVQFHPEKPLYEFTKTSIPHTSAAVKSGQFYADFFVDEARRNNQSYADPSELAQALIYNYIPHYTSILGSSYMQQYLFTDAEMGIEELDDSNSTAMPMANSRGFPPILLLVALSSQCIFGNFLEICRLFF